MPSSQEIRRQFIGFFTDRCGHTYVPSSPAVPHDDPTLLFTNAGMNQFKDVFLGLGSRPYSRAANTQKCIRAGGKHNDLDDVGKDTYHHTFFEMLGNWSFGDYFKKESINWAWELLTRVWGMDPTRLHATYFEGNPAEGLEPDEEARQLWLQFLPPERIHPGNMKDNFWEMGDTGPCGPCSEIHVDLTPDKSGGPLVNGGDARVIEIWNLVFIQYNRGTGGKLSPLPAKHVDTGMGFERLCAVLQGKTSNYDTDVFAPLFAAIRTLSGAAVYGGSLASPVDTAYRVIADHARTLTFAITDGAMPSNEGRGYVLRRILRRAARYGRQNLGLHQPFMHKLVDVLVKQMGDFFPELKKDPKHVSRVILEEEESFGRTLDRGIELFEAAATVAGYKVFVDGVSDQEIQTYVHRRVPNTGGAQTYNTRGINWSGLPNGKRPVITADDAFKLYDTYGFPLDLTQLMAEERGISVDVAGFERLMEEARHRSRGEGAEADTTQHSIIEFLQKHPLPATLFTGYEQQVTEAGRAVRLLAPSADGFGPVERLAVGQTAAIITDRTPFYAESGGQVGDTGYIHSNTGAVFRVTNTQRFGEVIVHLGEVESDSVKTATPAFDPTDSLVLEVDTQRRGRIVAHHTSTHLMNWALRETLGDHVQQKGSLVDDEKTRFDFSHGKPLTPQEIEQIERQVERQVQANHTVHTQVVPQEQAIRVHGLRAVFGEKYPPNVRVVSIGAPVTKLIEDPDRDEWRRYSVEFCGGTHLPSTSDVGAFAVIHEEGVAKGVRRITAVAGRPAERALAHAQVLADRIAALEGRDDDSLEQDVAALQEVLAAVALPLNSRHALREKLNTLLKVVKARQKQAGKAAEQSVIDAARSIADSQPGPVIVAEISGADGATLRTAMDVVRKKRPEAAMLLACRDEEKVSLLAAVPKELIAQGLAAGAWVKEAATVVGGSGGGKPDMAQAGGKNPHKLKEALDSARAFAASKLGV